ncbi:MAG TPA: ABC-2 family transporter protein [Ruminiclostridium sp.]|nr:ABC-2 family transporter protein [Ruminiclostridium sp.]
MQYSKYNKVLKISIQNEMEYRVSFILSIASCFFPVLIQYFLWSAVYASSTKKVIFGYSYGQMLAYTILASIVAKLVLTGIENEVAADIKNGGFSRFLIQPINYFIYRVSCFIGKKVLQTIILLVVVFGVLLALRASTGFLIDMQRIFIFILSLFFAFVLNFFISLTLSTIAFWMTEVWGIFATFGLLANIASGGIFPIDVFGQKLQEFLSFLPFIYTVYFPVNILTGRMPLNEISRGFEIQTVWIAVFAVVSSLLWKYGLKKYVAVGG